MCFNRHKNVISFFLLGTHKVTLFEIASSPVICTSTVGFGSNTEALLL